MKVTLLLLIVCLTEIYANNDREILRQCFQEYKEDFDALSQGPKITQEEIITRVTPYKFGCISVCYLKKQLVDPIPIRKHITDRLNESPLPPGFTDAEIATYKNEVNRCIEEAKTDDCKLIECLKPWSSETRIGKIIGIH